MRRTRTADRARVSQRGIARATVLSLVVVGTVTFVQFDDPLIPGPQPVAAVPASDVREARDIASRVGTRVGTRPEPAPPVTTPVQVTIESDSDALPVRTDSATVAEVLTENNVIVETGDVVSHELTAPLHGDMVISVRTPDVTVETVTKTVDFETEEVPAPHLEEGTEATKTEGRAGKSRTTYFVRTIDGEEVDRTRVARIEDSVVRDEVIEVGTMEVPEPPEASDASGLPAAGNVPESSAKVLSPDQARTVARAMLADRGWGDGEFSCLNNLWNRESNWRVQAENTSSGAYGIPQSLPGTKMASAGADWRTNAKTQISWGLSYISGRYGTPCGAWGAFQSKGWY